MNPFKSIDEFEKDLTEFSNKYKVVISEHSKRISDYFEMSCYNLIIQYYENQGYSTKVMNLINGAYRYKCSTSGVHTNFSYFTLSKDDGDEFVQFDLRHNIAVQSHYDNNVFTTPDISISVADSTTITTEYYETKKRFSYIDNASLVSFCEVKNFTPYPELIINFIGTVNELCPACMKNLVVKNSVKHIAPSLMMSGKCNKPTAKIKNSLEQRYVVNIIDDIYNFGKLVFSKKYIDCLSSLSEKKPIFNFDTDAK